MDPWTNDYFQPLGEPASLFGNDVGHLAEAPVKLIAERIPTYLEFDGFDFRSIEEVIADIQRHELARIADLTNQQQ